MKEFYENHNHPNPQFPFIFHLDNLNNSKSTDPHWHESIELLYFVEGSGVVYSNVANYPVTAGEIAVINSDNIHTVYSNQGKCSYYCLIVDSIFCIQLNIDIEKLQFNTIIRDKTANKWMDCIVDEMNQKLDFYQQSVISSVGGLLVYLCRYYAKQDNKNAFCGLDSSKTSMVKAGISIIRQKYTQPISVDYICRSIGFSKYYFCRVFKEYTGCTVVDYINHLRCCKARRLIRSGVYNIGESARRSGIPNLSYFSKTYKKYMGVSPSKDK